MARDTATHDERDEFGRLRKAGDRNSYRQQQKAPDKHQHRDRQRQRDDDYDHHHRSGNLSNRRDDSTSRHGHPPDDHDRRRQERGHEDHFPPPAQTPQPSPHAGTGRDEYYGPAHGIEDTVTPGMVVQGTISRLESYGAFLDFDDPKTGESLRGLIHISQMSSSQARVEQVSDVVTQNQKMHAVVLEVEYGGRQRRIRLSLKDVDQDSGKYRGPSLGGSSRGGGGSRPPPPRELERRARQRRDLYLGFVVDWKNGWEEQWDQRDAPGYLRQLWSASPEPPAQTRASTAVDKNKVVSSKKKHTGSKSSSTEDSSSSGDDRQSKTRKRSSRSDKRGSRSKSDRRGKRKGNHGRRRRRDDTSSSEESSSSSSSSESSSSSSSSSSKSNSSSMDSRHKKRAKGSSASQEKSKKIPEDAPPVTGNEDDPEWMEAQALKVAVQGKHKQDEDSGGEEGPMPLPLSNAAGGNATTSSSAYGKALLPGEGQAIAQFVQNNLRIPRRGEIGYSGDDIEQFENTGYVMSGSRHQRMNAVRIRKENQVYSAEEQRALALITMEENQQKEAQLMEDFRVMLKEKQRLREKEQKLREKAKA